MFSRSKVFCLKNWKLWQAPATIELHIFCWSSALVSYQFLQEAVDVEIVTVPINSLRSTSKYKITIYNKFFMNWKRKKKKQKKNRQFNADLYNSSINIAAEITPHSQSNDISHFKRHYALCNEPYMWKVRVGRNSFLTSRFWFWPWIHLEK